MVRREDRKAKEQKPKLPEFVSPEKKKEKMREDIRRKFQEAFGYEDDPKRRRQ